MTKYAEGPGLEAAKKALAEEQVATETSRAEYSSRVHGTPTPTQEELNMSMLGASILEHDDDGSGPDPYAAKSLEAGKGATYQTRQVHAAPHRPAVPRRAE